MNTGVKISFEFYISMDFGKIREIFCVPFSVLNGRRQLVECCSVYEVKAHFMSMKHGIRLDWWKCTCGFSDPMINDCTIGWFAENIVRPLEVEEHCKRSCTCTGLQVRPSAESGRTRIILWYFKLGIPQNYVC